MSYVIRTRKEMYGIKIDKESGDLLIPVRQIGRSFAIFAPLGYDKTEIEIKEKLIGRN
jgi:hypothetical protein